MAGITTANGTCYPVFDEDTDPLHTPLNSELGLCSPAGTHNYRESDRREWRKKTYGKDIIIVAEDGMSEGWIFIDGTYSPGCHVAAR